jgi:hypothetical protein
MKRILFVGFDPTTVDFSDPALPPGMTAEKMPPRSAFAFQAKQRVDQLGCSYDLDRIVVI